MMKLPADLEIHKINNNTKDVYCALDFARLLPPNDPVSPFTNLFRPEYMADYVDSPISADCFCGFGSINRDTLNSAAMDEIEVFEKLHIPNFCKKLLTFARNGRDLSLALHRYGINIRYLGKIRKMVDTNIEIQRIALREMVARTIKDKINHKLQKLKEHSPIYSFTVYRQAMCEFYVSKVFNGESEFWFDSSKIKAKILHKFGNEALSDEELLDDYNLTKSFDLFKDPSELEEYTGIKVTFDIAISNSYEFIPKVKEMQIVSVALNTSTSNQIKRECENTRDMEKRKILTFKAIESIRWSEGEEISYLMNLLKNPTYRKAVSDALIDISRSPSGRVSIVSLGYIEDILGALNPEEQRKFNDDFDTRKNLARAVRNLSSYDRASKALFECENSSSYLMANLTRIDQVETVFNIMMVIWNITYKCAPESLREYGSKEIFKKLQNCLTLCDGQNRYKLIQILGNIVKNRNSHRYILKEKIAKKYIQVMKLTSSKDEYLGIIHILNTILPLHRFNYLRKNADTRKIIEKALEFDFDSRSSDLADLSRFITFLLKYDNKQLKLQESVIKIEQRFPEISFASLIKDYNQRNCNTNPSDYGEYGTDVTTNVSTLFHANDVRCKDYNTNVSTRYHMELNRTTNLSKYESSSMHDLTSSEDDSAFTAEVFNSNNNRKLVHSQVASRFDNIQPIKKRHKKGKNRKLTRQTSQRNSRFAV
eukprot:TRINITY_DN4636_c0_g2_i1.p1 TRINITY_DN4636_c0_g2~~TRINITY_DN4636_c0_g2_i1.p1  ORF type:complete len:710 (-),score=134.69 TRINITY_DN4636_c0_g2_i1:60-2189(-)